MQLEQFLRRHYDDYVYIRKSDGTAIMDIMVKFVPYWVLHTYGDFNVEVELHKDFQNDKYKWWNVKIVA